MIGIVMPPPIAIIDRQWSTTFNIMTLNTGIRYKVCGYDSSVNPQEITENIIPDLGNATISYIRCRYEQESTGEEYFINELDIRLRRSSPAFYKAEVTIY
jgi:hypothetical protein